MSFARPTHRALAVAGAIGLATQISVADASTFPGDGDWEPLTRDAVALEDAGGSAQGDPRDLVGNGDYPVAYVWNDGTDLFLRLRLDADPRGSGGLRSFGWGVVIDTDGDLADFEFSLIANGITETIVFAENTTKTGTGDPTDEAEMLRSSYDLAWGMDGNVQVSQADSSIGGSQDYFLDFSFPIADLYAVGITGDTELRFVAGSSANARSLTVDVAGSSDRPDAGSLPVVAADPYQIDPSPPADCGNGTIESGEECDDGNLVATDGCTDACIVSPGYVCTGEPSVCVADGDGDGVPDTTDNCPGVANPGQEDSDNDGTGDACEAAPQDTDGDGVPDDVDNCPDVANPDQTDSDLDGLGDACDPSEDDADGDGVVDGADNCPALANPAQEDLDLDGIGDACDDDVDGDGFADGLRVSGGVCRATGGGGDAGTFLLVMGAVLLIHRRRRCPSPA